MFNRYCASLSDDLVKCLEALHKAVHGEAEEEQWVWSAVAKFEPHVNEPAAVIIPMTWAYYFPPEDVGDVSVKVFLVMAGIVIATRPYPHCYQCRASPYFALDKSQQFGWRLRCESYRRRPSLAEK